MASPVTLPPARSEEPCVRQVPLRPWLVGAGVVVAVELATHLADFGAEDLRIKILDSAYQWSWSHLVATAAFATAAVLGFAGAGRSTGHRRAWRATGGLFAFLFVDNVTRLHEHFAGWPVVYAPLLGTLMLSLAVVAWDSDQRRIVLGALTLLLASLAIHVLGPHVVRALGWGPDSWAYQVKVGLKEGSELAGWVLLLPPLARLALQPR
jgi:cytochrome bd-type quinol oxidase subunit 2